MPRITTFLFLLLSTFAALASFERGSVRPLFPEEKELLGTLHENAPGAPLIDRDYDALGRLTRYQHGADYTREWIYPDTDTVNKNAETKLSGTA